MIDEAKIPEEVRNSFNEILNRHGYSFQYGALKLVFDLFDQTQSEWLFEAVEFPVCVQGATTRIDFILRHKRCSTFYLLVECKRANPALSNWCFVRAPIIRRNRSHEPLFLEQAKCRFEKNMLQGADKPIEAFAPKGGQTLNNAYHIALEVKSSKTGDKVSTGRGTIEDAASQICRGVSGFIEFLSRNTQILGEKDRAYFLPVIFTTAQIWSSDVDLNSADVVSGNVNFSKSECKNEPWIAYQYHVSPGLKHSCSPDERPNTIGQIMELEYVRTIPIVNSSGIETFLRWSSNLFD